MRGLVCVAPVVLGVGYLLAAEGTAPNPSLPKKSGFEAGDWQTEQVETLNGRTYRGLIESEDQTWVNLIEIHRPRAHPMYLVIRPIDRASIAEIVRLAPGPRAALERRIERFVNRAQIEAGKMEAIRLRTVEREDVLHHLYRGQWFSLDCTTDQRTARRLIVRMEQVFTAYRQVLPPRVEPEQPLRLSLFGSLEEYHAHLNPLGLKISNRAVFFPQPNAVVAGSELNRYGAELADLKARHEGLRHELAELKADLPDRLKDLSRQLLRQGTPASEIRRLVGRERRKIQQQVRDQLAEVEAANRKNDGALDTLAGRMLTCLAHEAFHAYLENYVYPRRRHHVPHWLNEGLAVMFEGALFEAESLRLDAPNQAALDRLQADLASRQPLALAELLAADARDFLATPEVPSGASGRHYDYAWGLVYYLTFERHLLGSPALDAFVADDAQSMPPVARFERLVGTSLSAFEQAWREYIAGLR